MRQGAENRCTAYGRLRLESGGTSRESIPRQTVDAKFGDSICLGSGTNSERRQGERPPPSA